MRNELGRVLVGLILLGTGRFGIMLWASLTFGDATAGPVPEPPKAPAQAVEVAVPPSDARLPTELPVEDPVSAEETP